MGVGAYWAGLLPGYAWLTGKEVAKGIRRLGSAIEATSATAAVTFAIQGARDRILSFWDVPASLSDIFRANSSKIGAFSLPQMALRLRLLGRTASKPRRIKTLCTI